MNNILIPVHKRSIRQRSNGKIWVGVVVQVHVPSQWIAKHVYALRSTFQNLWWVKRHVSAGCLPYSKYQSYIYYRKKKTTENWKKLWCTLLQNCTKLLKIVHLSVLFHSNGVLLSQIISIMKAHTHQNRERQQNHRAEIQTGEAREGNNSWPELVWC